MNPVQQAMAASVVRWLMVWAGSHGIELGSDLAESIVNSLLMGAPLIWSLIHKKKVDTKIKEAQAGI